MTRNTIGRRTVLGAVALAAGLAGCTSSDDGDDSGGDGSPGGADEATVTVGPGGNLEFDPETVTIGAGGTVVWEWDSNTHNVVVESQPDGANWTAHQEGETFDAGHTYEHTFDVPGTYEYYCNPHRSAGMTGSVVVEE